MSKLLRANFARLWKSKIFWICMTFMFGFAAFAIGARYHDMQIDSEYAYPSPDGLMYAGGIYISIVIAVFIGVFIGTEYSDGTLRNKLIVGHSRIAVYISNLIVCIAAALMMHIIFTAVIVGAGVPLIGKFIMPVEVLVTFFFCEFATIVAFTTIYLLISMLIPNKATGSIVTIILSFVFIFASMTIDNKLRATEYYEAYTYSYIDENGNEVEEHVEAEKNPHYLAGNERKIYDFLYDFLPSCQSLQYGMAEEVPDDVVKFPFYSFFILCVTTGCGVFFFCKKNLK